MQLFIHYKVQKTEQFLEQLSRLNQLHQEKSYQFRSAFYSFIDALVDYYDQIGDANSQAEAEQLKNYYQTADDGYDPVKLEKVRTGKRAMMRLAAYSCLSQVTELLQRHLSNDKKLLKEAKDTLGNVILSLIQSKAITEEELAGDLDQQELEMLWHRLTQNEQVKLHERNLRLTVTQEDIFLLFVEIIQQIK